jgi:hypothetical protein
MFLEHTRRRKFTELVTHHVFGNENRIKILSVVNQKRVADKIRRYHRAARPGFDRLFRARSVHLVDLLQKIRLDEGSFLQRSSHKNQAICDQGIGEQIKRAQQSDHRLLFTDHAAFFFAPLLSEIKRSLGLRLLRVLNPLANCPHGLTG